MGNVMAYATKASRYSPTLTPRMVCAAAEKSPSRRKTVTSSRMPIANDRIVLGLSRRFLRETPSPSGSSLLPVRSRASATLGNASAIGSPEGGDDRGRAQQEAEKHGDAVNEHVVHQITAGQGRNASEQAE